jgi:4-amino-4-deoxy-L-arabinose transferase-like glycosyltransferase/tetratricopeptide (TPR) repeat protein
MEKGSEFFAVFEKFLEQRRNYLIVTLLIIATIFRIVYYLELNNSPFRYIHNLGQSDMHFYDAWAKDIEHGDWLTNKSLRQYTNPHVTVATHYFKQNPVEKLKYEKLAAGKKNITAGELLWNDWHGGKSFHQDPFYIYVTAIIYKVFGEDVRFMFIFQMLIGLATIYLVYRISKQHFGYTAAFISAIIMVFYGPALFYELILLRETMIIFFGLLLVFILDRIISSKDHSLKELFTLGLVLGCAVLLKITFIVFFFLAFVLLFIFLRRHNKKILPSYLITLAGFFMIYGLLQIRNAYVGAPLLSQNAVGPITLVNANVAAFQPEAGYQVDPEATVKAYTSADHGFFHLMKIALDTHENITSYLILLLEKLKNIFHWYEIPNNKNYYLYREYAPILNFSFINFIVVGPLGIAGLFFAIRQKKKIWALYLLVWLHIATLLVFTVMSRFRIPLAVSLIPFAGFGLISIIRLISNKNFRGLIAAGITIAMGLIIARPLSDKVPLIRGYDYASIREVYYTPRIKEALRKNDTRTAKATIEEYLSHAPGYIKDEASRDEMNFMETMVMNFFMYEHLSISRIYKKAGLITDSENERKLADRLSNITGLEIKPSLEELMLKADEETDMKKKEQLYKKAINEGLSSYASGRRDADLFIKLSLLYEKLDNPDSAIYYMDEALQTDPLNPFSNLRYGYYLAFYKKNLTLAIHYFEKARELEPRDAKAYLNLGITYRTIGNTALAITRLKEGLKQNPGDKALTMELSKAYMQSGRKAEAEKMVTGM